MDTGSADSAGKITSIDQHISPHRHVYIAFHLWMCVCSSLCKRPPCCSSIDFHFGWYRMSVYQSIEYLPALYLWHSGWSVAAHFFVFSKELCRETSVCVRVCAGVGVEKGQERARNQYIFTESPCVAGTETGRKEGARTEKGGKGFRIRTEVWRKGGKETSFFLMSCLPLSCLTIQ